MKSYLLTVVVTNASGFATASTTINTNVGINNNNAIKGLTIYPNPIQDVFVVNATVSKAQMVTVNLFDMGGKQVYTRSFISNNGQIAASITTSGMASGVYLLQIVTDEGSITRRVIKE